jgi:hypothetical protein
VVGRARCIAVDSRAVAAPGIRPESELHRALRLVVVGGLRVVGRVRLVEVAEEIVAHLQVVASPVVARMPEHRVVWGKRPDPGCPTSQEVAVEYQPYSTVPGMRALAEPSDQLPASVGLLIAQLAMLVRPRMPEQCSTIRTPGRLAQRVTCSMIGDAVLQPMRILRPNQ